MRIGQTSLVFFASKTVGSLVGFVATIYLARELGAGVFGSYSLILAVVAWAVVVGRIGITGAVQKRLSEGDDQPEFFSAGLICLVVTFGLLSIALFGVREVIESFVGRPLISFVILLTGLKMLDTLVKSLLSGYHSVHIMGMLIPVRMLFRGFTQIGLVFLGFGLVGMLTGHVVGYALVSLVGFWYVSPSLALPSRRHFQSLFSYARYSWLGSVENRVFGWIDITVLGLFVSSNLVGIYSIAWTVSSFFLSFSAAVSNAVFPEISELTAEGDYEAIKPILTDALRYAGLILIPGVVGGVLLNQRILRIYGPEFGRGGTVVVILLVVVLLRSYYQQMATTFNGIDRADITFRLNIVFIIVNLLLNIILVWMYGWVGAAVATAAATAIGAGLAYHQLRRIVGLVIPYRDLGSQWLAAGIMGLIVRAMLWAERQFSLLGHNFVFVLVTVGIGALVYFSALLVLSAHFRVTVRDNVPDAVRRILARG